MMECLAPAKLALLLEDLPDWTLDSDRRAIHRRLKFADFADALAAMIRIGFEAEAADHHPEWSNVYDTLDIWLTTHDAEGLTERDIALAKAIDLLMFGRMANSL